LQIFVGFNFYFYCCAQYVDNNHLSLIIGCCVGIGGGAIVIALIVIVTCMCKRNGRCCTSEAKQSTSTSVSTVPEENINNTIAMRIIDSHHAPLPEENGIYIKQIPYSGVIKIRQSDRSTIDFDPRSLPESHTTDT